MIEIPQNLVASTINYCHLKKFMNYVEIFYQMRYTNISELQYNRVTMSIFTFILNVYSLQQYIEHDKIQYSK